MTQRRAGIGYVPDWTGARYKSAVASMLCTASLIALPADAVTAAPTKMAIFDFELEDVSADASSMGETPPDAKQQLASVTSEIRSLFVQSGRYHLVDVGDADAPAAKSHTLRDCNGCDALVGKDGSVGIDFRDPRPRNPANCLPNAYPLRWPGSIFGS